MKKVQLNIDDVFNLSGSIIYEPDKFKPVSFVTIDSRTVKRNSLFVAVKGKNFDGHDFVRDAVKKGSTAIVITKNKLAQFDDINVPIITVKDTIIALGEIAYAWRKKLNTKVIGITGSAGKTTVKDMLAELLKEKYSVNKTIANNNNNIGVPITILSTSKNHDVLVAELGTNHFGEIPYTSKILSPDYGLLTNIGNSHLEFLQSKNGVWKEKSFLFDETIRNKGKVFLNYDDPIIKAKHSAKGKKVSYGFNSKVNVKGTIKSFTDDGRTLMQISSRNKKNTVLFPLYGEQNAKNFLAACAVALELGLSFNEINRGINRLKAPSGRLDVNCYKNFVLIDDTYNSNPDSAKAAIELVSRIKLFNRKILLLGDMLELGEKSIKLHKELKNVILNSGISEVYTIGSKMKFLHIELIDKKITAKHFTSRDKLAGFIKNSDLNNSVILVKGSRGMKMEEFLPAIKIKSSN